MKRLKEYIIERQLVGSLPFSFELFEKFINNCILNGEFDDNPVWNDMETLITSQYNETTWMMFKGWCESVYEFQGGRNSKISIKQFYDELSLIPIDRIKNGVGAGSNGVAWNMGKDKVIKLYYSDHIKHQDKIFIDYCYKNKSKVFPKIHRIGKNWIILEKLKTFTPKLRKWFEYLDDKKFNGKAIYDWSMEKNVDKSIFDNFGREVYDWCKQCQVEFKKINSEYITWPGDLSLKNCGERDNGDIIFFDV